jgi:hypothetical protein
MATRNASAVALAILLVLAAALPATAGARGKGAVAGATAPRGGVLGGAHDGTPVVRDHRGGKNPGGGVVVTSKPRPGPICAGWAC